MGKLIAHCPVDIVHSSNWPWRDSNPRSEAYETSEIPLLHTAARGLRQQSHKPQLQTNAVRIAQDGFEPSTVASGRLCRLPDAMLYQLSYRASESRARVRSKATDQIWRDGRGRSFCGVRNSFEWFTTDRASVRSEKCTCA